MGNTVAPCVPLSEGACLFAASGSMLLSILAREAGKFEEVLLTWPPVSIVKLSALFAFPSLSLLSV